VDSTYALAWNGISEAYSFLADDFWAPRDAYPKAKQAALRALALDPDLAEAHYALAGALLWYEWDYARGDGELRRALSLDPDNPLPHDMLAARYLQQGRFREAAAEARTAARLDPGNPRWEATANAYRARVDGGVHLLDSLRAAVREQPDKQHVRLRLLSTLLWVGRMREAAAVAAGMTRDFPGWYNSHDPFHAQLLAQAGDTLAARRVLEVVLAYSRDHYVRPTSIAGVYFALGDRESTLEWLERGVRERDGMLQFLDVWEWYDPLRGDPRFERVRRQVGLPSLGG